MLVGCLVGCHANHTCREGTDGAHVPSAKEQVGVCLWGQLHQPLSWVLEKEVFGWSIAFWWEEYNRLEKKKIQGYSLKVWVNNTNMILQNVFLHQLNWEFSRSGWPALAPCGWRLRVQGLWPGCMMQSSRSAPWCCPCTAAHSCVFQSLKMCRTIV